MAEYVNGTKVSDPCIGNEGYVITFFPPKVTEKGKIEKAKNKASRLPVELEGMTITAEDNTPKQQKERNEAIAVKMGKYQEREI